LGEHGCDEAVQIKSRDKIGVPAEAISRMQDMASGCQFDGGKNIFPEYLIQSLLLGVHAIFSWSLTPAVLSWEAVGASSVLESRGLPWPYPFGL
jgi:hypothetical protein